MAIGETSHQVTFLSVGWSVFGLALLLSVARIYGRFVMTRQPAADDYLMLLTLFTSTGMMIATVFLTSFLLGRHSWNITEDDRRRASQAYYAAVACFILTIAITKVAILLQLAKIFRPFTKRAFYWVCWGLLGFVVLWTVGTVLANLLICRTPGGSFWETRSLTNQCSITTWTIQGVISIALDCVLMLLPIPVVWQLHIPFKQKFLAFALLAVGSVGCFFSVVRTASLHTFTPSNDATYDLYRIPLWFTLEALVTVCCGALMGSKQLILHWFPSLSPKPHDILPPMQLDATPLDRKNSQNFIKLDNEDINKLRLESIMYRLAVIGSPWAQIPKSPTDTTYAAEQGLSKDNTTERHERSRQPSLTPSRPKPVRKSKGRKRHDSIVTQWTE
ncbi:hypothetical protein T440DRAFT_485560 [Plenodomus tracheiphilus IPT5]|uniref:Rhodopsin domain-containing protein n=1 Tax=Plenodomus tracheiphilus IPT5 TaxID=1408161 RepID=A0A6A7BJ43_9PLEO|nr:hypothetical protein T440DRAFT_485560 [Plenodomus tracheiphilus IPT5]